MSWHYGTNKGRLTLALPNPAHGPTTRAITAGDKVLPPRVMSPSVLLQNTLHKNICLFLSPFVDEFTITTTKTTTATTTTTSSSSSSVLSGIL